MWRAISYHMHMVQNSYIAIIVVKQCRMPTQNRSMSIQATMLAVKEFKNIIISYNYTTEYSIYCEINNACISDFIIMHEWPWK